MQRDFRHLDIYLNRLLLDDYGQEPDAGHTEMMKDVFNKWIGNVQAKTVLDVGCGAAAIAEPYFRELGMEYTGIALKMDAVKAQALGKNVKAMDMSFLEFEDNSFDMIWSRHSLEHAFSPIVSLFEWNRVSNHLLCVIVPRPSFYGRTGLNHYSVLEDDQWKFLFKRTEWNLIWEDQSEPSEYRYMAEKVRL